MSSEEERAGAGQGTCRQRRREAARAAGYWSRCVMEPFRLFFPLAAGVSVVAVLLWPAMFWGWIGFYPREMHGRLLIQGFVGGFAIGFLATAVPNILGSHRFRPWEVWGLLVLYGAAQVAHLLQQSLWGDVLFLALLGFFIAGVAGRCRRRSDLPPPGFVLVGGGLFCALLGTALFVWDRMAGVEVVRNRLATLLLFQGFLLLPMLGIGAFLFPRFFGTRTKQVFPEQVTPPPGWWAEALKAVVVGILIFASFVVEVMDWPRTAAWMRFAVCAVYLTTETGWWRPPMKGGILPWGVRLAILFVLGAYLCTGVLEAHQLALNHLLYVGGFGLLTMVVGTRVTLGHAGRSDLLGRWLKPAVWMVVMVALAALTRVSANFLPPENTISHWIYAALAWVVGVVVWGLWILRWLGKSEEDPPADASRPSAGSGGG